MNNNKGGVGRSKHRQAFGHDSVSRLVKLGLERAANQKKKKPISETMKDSIRELFLDKCRDVLRRD